MATTPVDLYALNDWTALALFPIVEVGSTKTSLAKTGTASAFIAISDEPDAVPIDISVDVEVFHVNNGRWLVHFDSTLLTLGLLDPIFDIEEAPDPVIIIKHSSGHRITVPCVYKRIKPANVSVHP